MNSTYRIVELEPNAVRFRRHGDTLTLSTEDGRMFPRVELRRCFPMSDDSRVLSVRDATTDDRDEIGILRDWTRLEPKDRRAVQEELDQFYFVPRIRSVEDISEEFGFLYWEVETDKGPMRFVMRDSPMRYARRVGPRRWVVLDINETRYEIPDLDALDAHSRERVIQALCL